MYGMKSEEAIDCGVDLLGKKQYALFMWREKRFVGNTAKFFPGPCWQQIGHPMTKVQACNAMAHHVAYDTAHGLPEGSYKIQEARE